MKIQKAFSSRLARSKPHLPLSRRVEQAQPTLVGRQESPDVFCFGHFYASADAVSFGVPYES